MDNFDVVVIGAGIGGVVAGALLAKKAKMKVLVLEKAQSIGGRMISFGGPHGAYTEEEYRRLLKEASSIRIVNSQPSVSEIIDKGGLFTDFIIDSGWHGTNGGSRCRYVTLAKELGKTIRMAPARGFALYHNGGWREIQDIFKEWPKHAREERERIAREVISMSREQVAEYDHVDFKTWLESQTDCAEVVDFFVDMAQYNLGIKDPKRQSAGCWMSMNNFSNSTGLTFLTGGAHGEPIGGFKAAVDAFAEIILENGGEIRTGVAVKEVVIKGHEASGVIVEQKGKTSTIEAKNFVCNIPVPSAVGIVPEKYFPDELLHRVKSIYAGAGVAMIIRIKELVEPKIPAGQFTVGKLEGGPSIRGGIAHLLWEQTTGVDPSRVLRGKGHYIQTFVGVSAHDPDEIHNDALVNQITEATLNFFRKQYPGFENNMEWYLTLGAERFYGISATPGLIGNRLPPVKLPTVKNLYFAGDTMTHWDDGSNGATHGGMICASAVTGQDYLQLLPPFMR